MIQTKRPPVFHVLRLYPEPFHRHHHAALDHVSAGQAPVCDPPSAAGVLEGLRQSEMVAHDPASDTYFFESNERTALVEQAAAPYASHLVEITLLIHSKLERKAQQFADAFNLRKDA